MIPNLYHGKMVGKSPFPSIFKNCLALEVPGRRVCPAKMLKFPCVFLAKLVVRIFFATLMPQTHGIFQRQNGPESSEVSVGKGYKVHCMGTIILLTYLANG